MPSRSAVVWAIRSRCQRRSGAAGSPQSPRRETLCVSSRGTSVSRQCVEIDSGVAASRETANKKQAADAANVFRTLIPRLSERLGRLQQRAASGTKWQVNLFCAREDVSGHRRVRHRAGFPGEQRRVVGALAGRRAVSPQADDALRRLRRRPQRPPPSPPPPPPPASLVAPPPLAPPPNAGGGGAGAREVDPADRLGALRRGG